MSKTEGDGQLERELYPGHPEPPSLPQGPQTTEYIIDVITSDISGAGTDANVKCVLYGDAGGCMPHARMVFARLCLNVLRSFAVLLVEQGRHKH